MCSLSQILGVQCVFTTSEERSLLAKPRGGFPPGDLKLASLEASNPEKEGTVEARCLLEICRIASVKFFRSVLPGIEYIRQSRMPEGNPVAFQLLLLLEMNGW